ncbi:adenylosuccinate synthetase [Dyella sp.]|uniref:adenylosuccinate synthetase n=1 Tax=Dyella sp. TaxID=1869338 RepID=UPI002ED5CB04
MVIRMQAVIGAGFGDEGKGRTVDALVADAHRDGLNAWVVRFNSGAQAGHTVVTPDGKRHVFHQVGSGALLCAPTYLGAEVALNPWLLGAELDALAGMGVSAPYLVADPRAPVSVPWDAMINQALEHARGEGRHGSCGVGFGETVERSRHEAFALRGQDLASEARVRARLAVIRHEYLPGRLAQAGLSGDALGPWMDSVALLDRFVADALALGRRLVWRATQVLADQDVLVFEGAQGLRLDQDLGDFPFVTRSHTGLPGIVRVLKDAGLDTIAPLEAHYVTRAYRTRHGAGPLADELPGPSAPDFHDPTNVPNPYQGSLRFAHLDPIALRDDIWRDLRRGSTENATVGVCPMLEVTCLDQMGPHTMWRDGRRWPTAELAQATADAIGIPLAAQAWGPARTDRREAGTSRGHRDAIATESSLSPCL